MKILRLEVCNLASLAASPAQPHVIDFTVSPLKDAGLLAITGATGAGKSTLLDAMCLALFNEVPRLRTAHLGQEGRLTDAKDQLSFGDKRTVLSRGAVEGFARVEFQGLDGGRYRAEWRVKRAYLKADGALQAVERSLRDLDHNVVLASKTKECAERIEQLIGMNFDQFTRAVLLAQSEFSTFLKANDGERAALLECLTDSGIYTELGKLAFLKAKTAREAKQQLEAQHGLVTPLDRNARQQLDQQLVVQEQACHSLAQQLQQLREQQAWYQRSSELTQQCDQAQVTHHAAQAAWHNSHEQRQQVSQRQLLAEVRGDYLRAKTLQTEIASLNQNVTERQQQVAQAEQALQQVNHALQQANQAWQDWQQQFAELKPTLAQAECDSGQLQHEQHEQKNQQQQHAKTALALNQQQMAQQQLQQALEQQQQTQQQLEDLLIQSHAWQACDQQPLAALLNHLHTAAAQQHRRQQAQQQYDAEQPALQALQQQSEQAQQVLQQHRTSHGDDVELQQQLFGLHATKASQHSQLSQLKDYQQYAQQQQQVEQQQLEQQADIQQRQQQIEQLHSSCQQTERRAAHVHVEYNTLSKQLQRQRMIQQHSVTELRAGLQPKQPCPVCGSTAHPYAGDLVDSAQLSLAEQLLQDSEQQLQVVAQQREQQQAALIQQQAELHHAVQQLTQRQQAQPQLTQQILAHSQAMLPLQQQLATQYSTDQLSRVDGILAQQAQAITQCEQQIQQVMAQQTEREHNRSHAEQSKQAFEQAKSAVTAIQQQIQHATQAAAWAAQQFLPQLALGLQAEWQQAIVQCSKQPACLADLVKQWQACLQDRRLQLNTRQQCSEQLEKLRQQLDSVQMALHNQQQHVGEQQQQLQQRQANIDQLKASIQQILPQDVPSVTVWQAKLEQQSTATYEQQQRCQQQQQHASQAQQAAQRSLVLQQHSLAHQQRERDDCKARVLAVLQQQPDLSREQLEPLMAISDTQLQQMQQHLQQQQRALDQAEVQLSQLQQQISIHQGQHPTTPQAEILTALTQQQASLNAAQEQRAETVATLREDSQRRQRYQALATQIEQAETEHQRWAKLAAPIGCATGATFRKIAQGYQLDSLLFYANQQLQLFSPRYQLQRAPNSLGLLVVDADLANERRAVHSLSGGESFLVSLALALALAQMASGQMQIESLFIDEGFGSLDPESLQVVMDALDQLQGQGRKVAVITHVQEMQERIPVQIRVERVGSGRSVLRVIG